MSFLNSLNRFVFKTRAGQLVVLVVAVLAGVVLLNPLLSGIRATDQSSSSPLYSETGIYSDGTEVSISSAGLEFDTLEDEGPLVFVLKLDSYKGSSRLPFDFSALLSESTAVGSGGSCNEQAFSRQFSSRIRVVAQDNKLPQIFETESLDGYNRDWACIGWSIVAGSETGPLEPGPVEEGSPAPPRPSIDYYLAIKMPETIGSPEVDQSFNRRSGQIYSRIGLNPQTLDFSEYGDVPISYRLPSSISVGYQYSVISNRAGCNQTRFPGNLRGFTGASNFKQYRSAYIADLVHQIPVLPSHVGKYICYQISWSDFGSSQLLHDTYFVTFEPPPITEPEEEVPPITEPEETEQKKAEIEELRRIFEEAKLKAEEAKLKAEEDRLKAEEARLNAEEARLKAEEIKREQERQNYVSYAIPDEFDLDEAVRVLRSLLTEEGLEDIEHTSFSLHPHGCADREEENPSGGCYIHKGVEPRGVERYRRRIDNTIYIRTHHFPEDYAQRSRAKKAQIIKTAVHILAHEFWHRNNHTRVGFSDIIAECYTSSEPDRSVIDKFYGWFGVSPLRLSYVEELHPNVRQCMRDHPEWGYVFAGLEERFLDENNPDPVELVDVSSSSVWEGAEDFSWKWYVEFYAETPTRNTHFPQALEDHYGRYFKDRTEFVDILRNDGLFFDIY